MIPARMKFATNCLWKIRNAISSGAVVISVAAFTSDHSTPLSVVANTLKPTVTGRDSGEFVTISGQRKLFQWKLIETSAYARYVGFANGMYTSHSTRHVDAPSTCAASSSEIGTTLKVWRSKNIPNADVRYGIAMPGIVSIKPILVSVL